MPRLDAAAPPPVPQPRQRRDGRSKVLAAVRRRWWVPVLVASAVAGLALLLDRPTTAVYTAETTLLVPTVRPGEVYPANIDNAVRLAGVYADVLPQDPVLLAAVSERTGAPVAAVRGGLGAFSRSGSPLLYVSWRGRDAQQAVQVVTAVAEVAAAPPAGSSVVPGTLSVFRPADASFRSATNPGQTLPAAVALGAVLGLLLLSVLERSDPRVDTVDDLSGLADCPVSVLDRPEDRALATMVEGWRRSVGDGRAVVCLMAADTGARARVERLGAQVRTALARTQPHAVPATGAARLVAGDGGGGPSPRSGGPFAKPRPSAPDVLVAGAPGTTEAGELVALASDVVVLVVFRGTRRRRVERSAAFLVQSRTPPVWCLLVPRSGLRPAA